MAQNNVNQPHGDKTKANPSQPSTGGNKREPREENRRGDGEGEEE